MSVNIKLLIHRSIVSSCFIRVWPLVWRLLASYQKYVLIFFNWRLCSNIYIRIQTFVYLNLCKCCSKLGGTISIKIWIVMYIWRLWKKFVWEQNKVYDFIGILSVYEFELFLFTLGGQFLCVFNLLRKFIHTWVRCCFAFRFIT